MTTETAAGIIEQEDDMAYERMMEELIAREDERLDSLETEVEFASYCHIDSDVPAEGE